MRRRQGSLAASLILLVVLSPACIFGSSDSGGSPSAARPSSIPTATMPANLPEPIQLGQAQAGAPAAATPAAQANTYTVRPGDTLFAIAAQLGVPSDQQSAWAAEVLRLNGIAEASQLAAGATLRLPASTAAPTPTRPAGATPGATASPPAAGSPTPVRTGAPPATPGTPGTGSTPGATATPGGAQASPTPRPGGAAGTYTVQAGDYPLLIAEKLNVPAAQRTAWANELVALNNISPTGLSVGQVLRLPAGTPGQ